MATHFQDFLTDCVAQLIDFNLIGTHGTYTNSIYELMRIASLSPKVARARKCVRPLQGTWPPNNAHRQIGAASVHLHPWHEHNLPGHCLGTGKFFTGVKHDVSFGVGGTWSPGAVMSVMTFDPLTYSRLAQMNHELRLVTSSQNLMICKFYAVGICIAQG